MPLDQSINRILKEMWRLDEKLQAGQSLDPSEQELWQEHLQTIKSYYNNNTHH